MNTEVLISDTCPECGCDEMIEVDSDLKTIPSGDHDIPPEQITIWLKEVCSNCDFTQVKDNSPDPDSLPGGYDHKYDSK